MIIGISGKIGSGKDTVGKILQHLSSEWADDEFKDSDMLSVRSDYQIKKFASKIKDIVCLLIGCTREQLEDREFKEKELGEEWNKLDKIALLAYNKDNPLCHEKGYLYNTMTPRKLLQLLGTEAGREIIHPNIWVNALFADYKTSKREFKEGNYIGGSCNDCGKLIGVTCDKRQQWCLTCVKKEDKPNWIITDVRFPNEAKAIKDRGGIVIRVNRNKQCGSCENHFTSKGDCPHCGSGNWVYGNIDSNHPSEKALDNYEFNHVIDNNGSIEELVEKVKQLNLV